MHAAGTPTIERLGVRTRRAALVLLVLGLAALAAAWLLARGEVDGARRLKQAWLVATAFVLTISLGALFFVILQHLLHAGWSVAVRRVAELLAANVGVTAVLVAPLVALAVAGDGELWPWADPRAAEGHPLLAAKEPYLNGTFFALRCAAWFGAWWLMARWFLNRSLAQDEARDAGPTQALERRAPPAMVAFALTVNFAAFDLLMSLSPEWYSTIFGVYVFAGSVVAFLAATILILRALQSRGLLRGVVSVEHYHDLGKLLFAFVFFWGYIAFSQFMLIWYADIPEETAWFHARFHGPWAQVSLLLLLGHFVLPFAGLLSRHAKRCLPVLTLWAAWLLVAHAVDLVWLVHPGHHGEAAPFQPVDALAFVAVLALWGAGLARVAVGRALVPVRDPRLHESLTFENV
ncbi:MAG: quinol:cytochrome C oxidoreductase [Planctomycetes bacterium]|nr:quinol:cytochrome C oxidoreductase [Planctomycetota bacterium]